MIRISRRFCVFCKMLCGGNPRGPEVRFAFFSTEGNLMATTAPNIIVGGTLGFGLIGNVPAGTTFVEPTIGIMPSSMGTVQLQPSVLAAPAGDGSVQFTTAGIFTSSGTAGSITLSGDVLGVDDADITFMALGKPGPEMVGFDPSKFVVGAPPVNGAVAPPPPPAPPAAVGSTQPVSGAATATTASPVITSGNMAENPVATGSSTGIAPAAASTAADPTTAPH